MLLAMEKPDSDQESETLASRRQSAMGGTPLGPSNHQQADLLQQKPSGEACTRPIQLLMWYYVAYPNSELPSKTPSHPYPNPTPPSV